LKSPARAVVAVLGTWRRVQGPGRPGAARGEERRRGRRGIAGRWAGAVAAQHRFKTDAATPLLLTAQRAQSGWLAAALRRTRRAA